MLISKLIEPSRIACGIDSSSKKRTLESLSKLIANDYSELSAVEIFDSLIGRERLGSTGLGKGVAIPHGRLNGAQNTIAAFVSLNNGVDFDSADGQAVDLCFALLVPEESTEEHLQVLSSLSEMLRNETFRQTLRKCESPEAVHSLIRQWEESH